MRPSSSSQSAYTQRGWSSWVSEHMIRDSKTFTIAIVFEFHGVLSLKITFGRVLTNRHHFLASTYNVSVFAKNFDTFDYLARGSDNGGFVKARAPWE